MKKQVTSDKLQVTGKVIRGDGYGKTLGFPTANLDRRDYVKKKFKIKFGVWAGVAKLKVESKKFKVFKAGIVIGPLDNHRLPKIEAHLVGFKGNLYGKKVVIELKKYVRSFKKYKDVEDLKKAIKQDIERVKKLKLL